MSVRADAGAGASAYEEYLRSRQMHKVQLRDKRTKALKKALAGVVPLGLLFAAVLAFGVRVSGGVAVFVGIVIVGLGVLLTFLRFYGPEPEVENWRAIADAERTTARTLGKLKRSGCVLLHDRAMEGTPENLDHLVIGPSGVHLVISEPAAGIVRYNKDGAFAGDLPLAPVISRTNGLAEEVRRQLREAMPMMKVPVIPVLAMVHATVLWKQGAINDVMVIGVSDVPDYIKDGKIRMSPGEATQVVATAARIFPSYVGGGPEPTVNLNRAEVDEILKTLQGIRDLDGDARPLLEEVKKIQEDLARQGALIGAGVRVGGTPVARARRRGTGRGSGRELTNTGRR